MRFLRSVGAATCLLGLAGCGNPDQGQPVQSSDAPVAVRHFFVIVMENRSFNEVFGPDSLAPYLGKTLPQMGQLLTQYYGIAHNSLPNYITMISGQPANLDTQQDCEFFHDLIPGIPDPNQSNGVILGQSCVYPSGTMTVVDQLEAQGFGWKGYMQDLDDGTTHTCRHPALNTPDTTQGATAANQYATRHNPFVYFHDLIDDQPRCDAHVVDLSVLDEDLKSIATTPNYAFITPDLCADGHDATCADGTSPAGYEGIDAFLQVWVPKILGSPAFQQDGVLLIMFDETDGGAPGDNAACCSEPSGPNTILPGSPDVFGDPAGVLAADGGGRSGAVVISRFTIPGSVNDTPYNHYSMLRSVENMFGLDYLGYAGQAGLQSFGADVFNNGPAPAGSGN